MLFLILSVAQEVVSKKRQQPQKSVKSKQARVEKKLSKDYCDDDPDYAVWLPPQGLYIYKHNKKGARKTVKTNCRIMVRVY